MKNRNPIAKALRTSAFRSRIVKSKKGKGSYSRKHFSVDINRQ